MDKLTRLAAELRLSRAIAKSYKEANGLMDRLMKQPKKPLGTK
jgi:hypothetical protein